MKLFNFLAAVPLFLGPHHALSQEVIDRRGTDLTVLSAIATPLRVATGSATSAQLQIDLSTCTQTNADAMPTISTFPSIAPNL